MICNQIVYGFHQRPEGLAVVFFFKQEFLFGEDLDKIHEAIAAFFAQTFGVRRQVREDSYN